MTAVQTTAADGAVRELDVFAGSWHVEGTAYSERQRSCTAVIPPTTRGGPHVDHGHRLHAREPDRVEDSAPKFGFEGIQEARFASDELDAADTGISYHRVMPGNRQAFAHRHDEAEEIYVVLAGKGRMKLDDDIIDVKPLDAIRVAPTVTRQFEAGRSSSSSSRSARAIAVTARSSRTGGRTRPRWRPRRALRVGMRAPGP